MTELLLNSLFGRLLLTLAVSVLPILELRAGIPFGAAIGLTPWEAFAASVVGNMIPVPFIVLFARKVLVWLRGKSRKLESWIERLESHAEGKWEQVHHLQDLGLLLLVAVPLPGTGAWTGALIAGLINMRLRRALLPIFLGVLIAGLLTTGITCGFTALF